MRLRIHRQRVRAKMRRDHIEKFVGVRALLLHDAYLAGNASGIDAPKPGVERDGIGSPTDRHRGNDPMIVEVEDDKQGVASADDEGAAKRCVDCKTCRRLAGARGPCCRHSPAAEIYGGERILAFDILVEDLCCGIDRGKLRLAAELDRTDNRLFLGVDEGCQPRIAIGDIDQIVKPVVEGGVGIFGDAIRFFSLSRAGEKASTSFTSLRVTKAMSWPGTSATP